MIRSCAALVLLITVLTACEPVEPNDFPEVPAPETWIALLNGEDLTGWTPKFAGHPAGVNHMETFRVEDGVLHVSYDAYDTFGGAFGHLFYDSEYSSYVLRLEYRFTGESTPGAPGWAYRNSGIMVHGQSVGSMRVDQAFPVSIEVQLLGGDGTNPRPTGNVCTPGTHIVMDGALTKQHCLNSSSPTFHGDGWVTVEVEVRSGHLIRHSINGVPVLEYTDPQLDPADQDAQTLIAVRSGDVHLTKGTICLQAEGHACAFRKIELRRLPE